MTIEELVVKITSDTAGLESGFSKISAGAGKVASAIGKTVAAATVAGAAAVGALATSAIQSYAEYEQLIGGVETLFKGSAGVVEEYANNAYKTAGLSANQYMETVTSFSASLLQSLGGDTAAAAKSADGAITDMADNANKMGTSIESIQTAYQGFAKQNYTMLDNLKLGYGGTKEEMQRLLDDAEKLSGVKYDISNLNDVYSAIHVVQTELGITGTTAKEASSTISGSLGMMKSAWANMLTGIADENADFDSLVGNLVDSVGTFADNIIPRVEIALKGVGKLVEKLAPIIADALPGLIDSIVPSLVTAITSLVDSLVGVLPDLLPTLVDAVINIAMSVLQALIDIFPELIDAIIESLLLIVDAIAENLPTITTALVEGLIAIVQAIIDNLPLFLDTFLKLILSFVDALIQAIPLIIAALPQLITSLITFIISAIPQIIQAGIQLLVALVQALPEIIQQIVAVLPEIISSIITALLEALPLIIQCGIDLLVALVEALPTIISTIVAALPQIITAIIDAIVNNIPLIIETGVKLLVALVTNLPKIIFEVVKAIPQIIVALVKAIIEAVPQMAEAGLNLVKGLFNGISNAVSWLYGKLKGWVSGVLSFIKGLFGIHSPSTVFAGYGKYMEQGLANGIIDNTKFATDAIKKTANAMENAFNPNLDIPVVGATIDKSQLDALTTTARVTPVLTNASGLEVEQESKLQTVLQDSNSDIIQTLIQTTRQLIGAIEENQTTITLGDEDIAASAARGNNNYKKRTGQPIFV